jgi:hypothetical protein
MLGLNDISEVLKDVANCELVLKNNTHYSIKDRLLHVLTEHCRV